MKFPRPGKPRAAETPAAPDSAASRIATPVPAVRRHHLDTRQNVHELRRGSGGHRQSRRGAGQSDRARAARRSRAAPHAHHRHHLHRHRHRGVCRHHRAEHAPVGDCGVDAYRHAHAYPFGDSAHGHAARQRHAHRHADAGAAPRIHREERRYAGPHCAAVRSHRAGVDGL